MFRFVAVVLLLASVVAFSAAQLTYSTGWGKRSLNGGETNCKSSMDAVMAIYKLIQLEAQKMMDCERFAK
ncbi:PREDICTED: hypertrehalosaemic prohormone-like [Nicrophorus vespilloides]|uniref:Hypertrehalosaemic prohormone-like n=1 Tax=Nicrophorus vespilloides TaxID=110193 RepID=A0ABM1M4C1_NICVS|nr:PREDICTED: hypertrehalosaemic prohormone-like [Nicrophorus vespilloides]